MPDPQTPQPRRRFIKWYGWVPDIPDQRDHLYAAPPQYLGKLPVAVDLSGDCPSVYDQGELGSCTANAIAAAIQFDQIKQAKKDPAIKPFAPSRLFIYYNERDMEGTVDSDSGAQIRDGIKSVASIGSCPETDWPYEVSRFRDRPIDPPCYRDATLGKVVLYQRVARNVTQMKGCLTSGFPYVFGFTVYESFESPEVANTGVLNMPAAGEQALGGHAVLAVGYDDSSQRFLVRNSWGNDWGKKGYFTMPYAYLTDGNLSDDFWTIRLVAQNA